MIAIGIAAVGAVSSQGRGRDAFRIGEVGTRPRTAVREAPWLRGAGLRRPFAALVSPALLTGRTAAVADPARLLLDMALTDIAAELDRSRSNWRSERVAVCLGTSSASMASQVEVFERAQSGDPVPSELATRAPYFGPTREVRRHLGLGSGLDVQILSACASSTFAIGLGCRWLELGFCDIVIAGGYDAVSLLVAAGFESLGATSASAPRPFCTDRDGLCLGDGAALVALVRVGDDERAQGFVILGFGASADAFHPTAPDPTGRGLRLAAQRALSDGHLSAGEISVVSAHGTATPYNDAAELRVLEDLGLERAVVHPFKSVVGHTLGAAGALELLALREASELGVLPASAAVGPLEPRIAAQLLGTNRQGAAMPALKLSAAFAGANAALVVGASRRRSPRKPRRVVVVAVGEPCTGPDVGLILGAGAKLDEERLWRLDDLSAIVLTAVANAQRGGRVPMEDEHCAVIVGSAVATLEANARFDRRRRTRGATCVEPRLFPATSPNLAAGHVSMAFGWHGPSIAVGAGLSAALEALLVAHDLVACGDAECCWCIGAEVLGDTSKQLWRAAGWPLPAEGAVALLLALEPEGAEMMGWLVRDAIQAWRVEAEARLGVFSGQEPGWPSLLAAARGCSGAQ